MVLCDVDKYSRCGFYYLGSTLKCVICPDTRSGQVTMYSPLDFMKFYAFIIRLMTTTCDFCITSTDRVLSRTHDEVVPQEP